jgi:protein ImuA
MLSELTGSRRQIVAALARRLRELEGQIPHPQELVSTGCPPLDRLLPAGGLRRGSLVEWLSPGGSGAGVLALLAAGQACRQRGPLVVVDRQAEFYPPAAAALGIHPQELLILRPQNARDQLWALEQVLASPGVGAVWCSLQQLSDRAFRRLQLAAERGATLGLLLRPIEARRTPSWADLRLLVQPLVASQGRRVCLRLLHCRGEYRQGVVELEIDDETGVVHLVPRLAPSTALRRAARA